MYLSGAARRGRDLFAPSSPPAGDTLAFTARHRDGTHETCEVRRGDVRTSGTTLLSSGVMYVNLDAASSPISRPEAKLARARGVLIDVSARPGTSSRCRRSAPSLARCTESRSRPRREF